METKLELEFKLKVLELIEKYKAFSPLLGLDEMGFANEVLNRFKFLAKEDKNPVDIKFSC
jgi:hypothetical protein